MERAAPLSVETIVDFASTILVKNGVPERSARTTAEHMIWADARGTETHGLVRLPHYVRRIQEGLLDPKAEPHVDRRSKAAYLVDGGNGLGHPAADVAMRQALRGAGEHGIAMSTVRNSGHFGAAGAYSAMAAEQGRIGIVMSNAAALMAPVGGTERLVGNNPVSIAVPFGEFPIILDMAMSAVAAWSVRLAADRGESIPQGWGLDEEGAPTTDPKTVLNGGLLRPVGDHKGYGLALMVDLLTGVLSGGGFGDAVKRLEDDAPVNASHTCIAIDVDTFMPAEEFQARVHAMVSALRGSSLAQGAQEILVPGEREARIGRQRRESGIAYPADIFALLESTAEEAGIAAPQSLEPAGPRPGGQ